MSLTNCSPRTATWSKASSVATWGGGEGGGGILAARGFGAKIAIDFELSHLIHLTMGNSIGAFILVALDPNWFDGNGQLSSNLLSRRKDVVVLIQGSDRPGF